MTTQLDLFDYPNSVLSKRNAAILENTQVAALCKQFRPFIVREAYKIRRRFDMPPWTLADLIQEGQISIAHAFRTHDASKSNFFTYIHKPVRWRMARYARKAVRVVHVPEHRFHTSPYKVRSLDAPLTDESCFSCVMDVEDFTPRSDTLMERLCERSRYDTLHTAMESLEEEERTLLTQLFMDGHTLRTAGKLWGVSGSRISVRKLAAMDRLRRILSDKREELLS